MPCARIRVAVVALFVLSVGTLAFRPASAQEATPTANTGHPLVGAWILDRDTTQPTNPLQLIVATADGLYLGVEYGGRNAGGGGGGAGPPPPAATPRLSGPIP